MRYIKITVTILFFISTIEFYGQDDNRTSYCPIWTFHQKQANINGMSLGIWSLTNKPRYTNTNGIRIELLGVGLVGLLFGHDKHFERDSLLESDFFGPLSERINGLNLSLTGTWGDILVNGVSLGLCGQNHFQINGVSISIVRNGAAKHNGLMVSIINDGYFVNGVQLGVSNYAYKTSGLQLGVSNFAFNAKGVQIGVLSNYSKEMKGIQISFLNKSSRLRGIQIGIWNINQKRKFPIINWSF